MPEYIEREALLRDIGDNPSPIYEAFRIVVKRQPTADVAEVRRGKWIATEEYETDRCNLCGFKINWDDIASCEIYDIHYCPKCGAKMGDDEE